MANLVSPGYKNSSLINSVLSPIENRIIEFKGLNRKSFVDEGEMSDMWNLTSDNYPLLCPRKLRGTYELPEGVKKPLSIMTRYERIALIAEKEDGAIAFFYDGEEIPSVTGLTVDTSMVAINTKICFFPQKTYLSIEREGSSVTIHDYGYMEADTGEISASIDISLEEAKVTLPTAQDYKYDDAIDLAGTLTYTVETESEGQTVEEQKTVDCTVSCVIEEVNGNVLTLPNATFIELVGEGVETATFEGSIKREVPDLIHVIEWNNRLWGASDKDNTIYACKLGDPTNWKYFQGTSMDSYYAQQGTDENWTGSAAYSGHLIFFKENRMTKVYGTSPSSFQVTNARCFGVEEGSSKSVVVLNDKVLYKSTLGIMAYDGGIPYLVSERLNCKFKNVVAGTEGVKYYASYERDDGENELMVLDIDKATWHKEDDVRFRSCTLLGAKLYFIADKDTDTFKADTVYIINPDVATETKKNRKWQAVFGPFDEYVENKKIYSKMSLRFIAQPYTKIIVSMKSDDNEWIIVREFAYTETGGETIYIVPRRCDRFWIKVQGVGDCEIKTLTRRFRSGGTVKP